MSPALQVAFMTGQSDPGSCALSPVQAAFLDALCVPDPGKVRRNFPYWDETPGHRTMPLFAASWHNARQYRRSRKPAFAEMCRPSVLRVIAGADRTVLLAGSCGLELLANLSLPDAALARVHVFAYGPVARHRPACDIVTVRGRRDWISVAWGGPCDHPVDGGHLAYLTNPEVLALCQAFVGRVAARGSGAAW